MLCHFKSIFHQVEELSTNLECNISLLAKFDVCVTLDKFLKPP